MDPIRAQAGLFYTMSVLAQAPSITKQPPILHPTLIPNLSSIKLLGVAIKGWNSGLNNTLSVTITSS